MNARTAAALSALLDSAYRLGIIDADDDWESVEAKLDGLREEEP